MMKKLFIATCLLLPGLVYSAATPLPSGFDARMQTVSYNGANTTVIRSKTGFLTSVVFDEGEAVISAK
ncbi:TriH protein, partial [Salmonella enterica subsp. enterica]|nr:TriH protein [Salmonella enterica subsp. enterica]